MSRLGGPAPRSLGRAARLALRLPNRLYSLHLGWLLGRRFLQLTHVGRSTGRRYHTILEVVGSDRATGELFVMAGFGPSSDWFKNLRAAPEAEVRIGRRRFAATHRILDTAEAIDIFASYEQRNRVIAPIIRRVLSRLLGWEFDGSVAARERLARELPMVALRAPLAASQPG